MTPRDNGLPRAARYVELVDVDPPVADHVLALLRDAGVSALSEPVTGETGHVSRAATPPTTPTERVSVDHEHVARAVDVVGRALPSLRADFRADAARREDQRDSDRARRAEAELDASEVESRFAGIVAGFADEASDPVPRWSVLEDAGEPLEPDEPPAPVRPPLSSRLVRRSGAEQATPEEDLEEHFVPPPPPPLPETDRITRLAWAALIGGPALIILAALFRIPLEGWLGLAALGSFLGGFATLVARMRDRPPHDDGWDDGAVL